MIIRNISNKPVGIAGKVLLPGEEVIFSEDVMTDSIRTLVRVGLIVCDDGGSNLVAPSDITVEKASESEATVPTEEQSKPAKKRKTAPKEA